MVNAVLEWVRARQSGQSLAEYALILALIAVFCVVALGLLGGQIATTLNSIAAQL
jgi:Flp pilus assembly pilin Flp